MRGLSARRSQLPLAALPYIFWLLVFYLPAQAVMAVYSFWRSTGGNLSREWTLANYAAVLNEPVMRQVMARTLGLALLAVAVLLLLGYSFAYYVSQKIHRPGVRLAILVIMIMPFLTGNLIRTLAWTGILGRQGLINAALQALGLTGQPLDWLLYSQFAVAVTLVYNNFSLIFFPIYIALETMDGRLLRAAADLGAPPRQVFLRVVLPVTMPGVLAGTVLVFVSTVATMLEPQLLGGTSGRMIGNLIASKFLEAFNWPLGAALALSLMVVIAAILLVYVGVVAVRFRLTRPM